MTDWLARPDEHLDPVVAEAYDKSYSPGIGQVIDALEALADGGAAVEFAIGTGRIAVPLSERGVRVSGMDFSEPMLAELRAKTSAESIHAVHGDMTTTVLGHDFAMAYLVFNTIMNLRTQNAQVECFINAARHLRAGGCFVMEVMVPQIRQLPVGETILPFDVSPGHLGFEEHIDLPAQMSVSHHYWITGDRVRTSAGVFRYVWPSELDLMARIAGLELEHRWQDWDRSEFTGDSPKHVSIWRKP